MALLLLGLGLSTAGVLAWAAAFSLCSVLIMAILSRKYGGLVHYTSFCPMGLVVNVLGRLSPWRIRIDAARCNNCGTCEKMCRYAALNSKSRIKGKPLLRCSLCRDCVGACPHKAIRLCCPGKPLSSVRSEQRRPVVFESSFSPSVRMLVPHLYSIARCGNLIPSVSMPLSPRFFHSLRAFHSAESALWCFEWNFICRAGSGGISYENCCIRMRG